MLLHLCRIIPLVLLIAGIPRICCKYHIWARAATTPGHAMVVAYENKCRVTEELCREQGIAFIPIVAESLGGWHQVAMEQFRKLGSALARHTGQEEGEKVDHLFKRVSILLQKGLSAMLLNRIPSHPAAEIDGLM